MNLAQDSGGQVLVPHLPELIIGIVAFGLLCFVLMKFVFPRMEQTYQARVEAIEGGIARAEQAQQEANSLLEQYRSQLAHARSEAAHIRDEAREEGHRIVEEMRAQAQAESDRIVARGGEQLAAERQQLVSELRDDIGRLSVELASQIVGETLADEVRRKGTVERFMSELENSDLESAGAGGR